MSPRRQSAPTGLPEFKSADSIPVRHPTPSSVVRGSGAALEAPVRAAMENKFDTNFGAVRIHADSAAAEAARGVGAAAYTLGQDIVFGAGRYQPQSGAGQQLLAHELAHVVQQASGGASVDAETRADDAAARVTQGKSVSPQAVGGAPVSLQAKPDDAAPAGGSDFPFPLQTLAGFALNSSTLTGTQTADIEKLAWSISLHLGIRVNSRATIAIVGHTDRSGTEQHNQTLGQARSDEAKRALIAALKQHGIGEDKVGEIASSSLGESSPAVPTADGVKNDKNRRVEITVTIGAQPSAPSPKPTFDPFAPLPSEAPPLGPRRDPSADEQWRRMEENRKKTEDFDRKHPPVNKSLSEAVIDKVMDEVVDPLIKKLPVSKDLQDLARSGVRKGLEKGSEAACDAAVDGTRATGSEAEGLKAACKAALKTKPGGAGGSKP